MASTLINVGIAEIGIASNKDILRTILGSCVGVCLYDAENLIGGLSHIMLPTRKTNNSSPKKYADSAIDLLIEEMITVGARRNNLKAKVVGGATMFNLSEKSIMGEIGKRNIAKVKEHLGKLKIQIVGQDVGGDYGRTIDFFMETGEIKVKSLNKELLTL